MSFNMTACGGEDIDWVTLTDRNTVSESLRRRGKNSSRSVNRTAELSTVLNHSVSLPVGMFLIDFIDFTVKLMEKNIINKTTTGRSVIPHSTGSHHGVVTIKATPYSSIMVTQKPWGTGHSFSTKSAKDVCHPMSPRKQKLRSKITPEMESSWEDDSATIVNKKSLPDTRRDRRIMSRMLTGQMSSVKDLPLPELFE